MARRENVYRPAKAPDPLSATILGRDPHKQLFARGEPFRVSCYYVGAAPRAENLRYTQVSWGRRQHTARVLYRIRVYPKGRTPA